MIDVQIIEKDGEPEYAVVPYAEWQRLREAAEVAEEVVAYDRARAESAGQANPQPGAHVPVVTGRSR